MIVYQTDKDGFYVGTATARKSPREPDVWLIPGGAVTTEPPSLANGEQAQWNGVSWVVIPAPEPEPEPIVTQSITMSQLLKGLMEDDWITPAQADAWSADGTLPPQVNTIIDALPTEKDRVAARINARRMQEAYRNDPLLIGAAKIADPEKSDEEIAEMIAEAFTRWSKL